MSTRRRRLTVGLAAFLLVATSNSPTFATTVIAPTLANLAARAERIVVSEVVDVRVERRQTRDGHLPFTLVTLRTVLTIKGAASVQFLLELPGGEAGDEALEVVGLPRFRVGDRDVLFLADSRWLSPFPAFALGRYRLVQGEDAGGEMVTGADGRPFRRADGTALSLRVFEREIRVALEAATIEATPRTASELQRPSRAGDAPRDGVEAAGPMLATAQPGSAVTLPVPVAERWLTPFVVSLQLGSSPALLNSCADWACAVDAALQPFGAAAHLRGSDGRAAGGRGSGDFGRGSGPSPSRPSPTGPVSLEIRWATEVFGRPMDETTLAVTTRQVVDGRRTVTLWMNRALSWNAYDGPARVDAAGRPLPDMGRVVAAELREVFETSPGETALGSPQDSDRAAAAGATPSSDARGQQALAPDPGATSSSAVLRNPPGPCGSGSDIVSNPGILTFQSADHSMMTGYEVGFFRPGASSPDGTVTLGREGLMLRGNTSRQPLVVVIQRAGLAPPEGVVYTYRVRGLWSGGTTAWSEPSEPFVTCPGTAASGR